MMRDVDICQKIIIIILMREFAIRVVDSLFTQNLGDMVDGRSGFVSRLSQAAEEAGKHAENVGGVGAARLRRDGRGSDSRVLLRQELVHMHRGGFFVRGRSPKD